MLVKHAMIVDAYNKLTKVSSGCYSRELRKSEEEYNADMIVE